jgi:hypothetical protein
VFQARDQIGSLENDTENAETAATTWAPRTSAHFCHLAMESTAIQAMQAKLKEIKIAIKIGTDPVKRQNAGSPPTAVAR